MSHKCGGPSCYRIQGRRSECPSCSSRIRRLRARFEALPKDPHAANWQSNHPDMKPEWVMMVIDDPYDQWLEPDSRTQEPSTILAGRVPASGQWIKVVFVGSDPETRRFKTAYRSSQLMKIYGGRPWEI